MASLHMRACTHTFHIFYAGPPKKMSSKKTILKTPYWLFRKGFMFPSAVVCAYGVLCIMFPPAVGSAQVVAAPRVTVPFMSPAA